MTDYNQLDAWIDAHFDEEVRFLQEMVRVPTDTPPGNNAPHAERTAELLQAFGFEAEKRPRCDARRRGAPVQLNRFRHQPDPQAQPSAAHRSRCRPAR